MTAPEGPARHRAVDSRPSARRRGAPLVAIVLLTAFVLISHVTVPNVGDEGTLPDSLPTLGIPDVPFTLATLQLIAPYALGIALVGLMESLMTAKLVDDVTDTHSDKTRESWGQGVANIVTGFFGGMGGCAMIGQTMINVKASGARTRLSTFLAGVFLLILVVALGDVVAMIPMAALLALHQAICEQPSANAGLVWLICNRHVAPLLGDLATGRLPLTHATLDAHPSPQTAMHLRDMLMQHELLPHRDRYLVLFENWLRGKLDAIEPAEDQQLVRRFATWRSLRQLRQRAAREPLRPGLTKRHCHEINSATALLAWLREYGTTPKACTQAFLDEWIATGKSSRQGNRAFVVWSVRNGTMPRHLHLPYHQSPAHETITQAQRLQLLRDLIDPAKPFFQRDRAAALLLTLFAQPLTRIAALTMNDIDLGGEEVRITLGPHGPIPVPEPFGQILRDHAANRGPRNIEANRNSPWLFPGRRPAQHVHSTYLMNQLAKSRINLLGTRLAAIRTLVLEMPPAIAAQALGYTPECAEDHATLAGATWAGYAAYRRQRGGASG